MQQRSTARNVDGLVDGDVSICREAQGGPPSRGRAGDGCIHHDVTVLNACARGGHRDICSSLEQRIDRGVEDGGVVCGRRPGAAVVHVTGHRAVDRSRRDRDVVRVKEPLAGHARGGRRIACHTLHIQVRTRGLDSATVATLRATPRAKVSGHPRHPLRIGGIRPDHHGAAIALLSGRGIQPSTRGHHHRIRRGETSVLTLPAPTHQHLTPTCGSARLQPRGSTHKDLVPGDQNLATTGAGLGTTRIQLAFHGHHATLTALQKNSTVLVDQALRSGLAGLLDHTLKNGIGTSSREHHHAAIGPYDMTVRHQCIHHGRVHHHREAA